MSLSARSAGAALFGLFVGAWIGRAIFVWVLDVGRTWEIAGVVAVALVGAVLCIAGEAEDAAKRASAGDG